jgi:hypothetical protein
MTNKLDAKTFTWTIAGLAVIVMAVLSLYWSLFITLNNKIETVRIEHTTTKTTLDNHLNFRCEDNDEH